MPFFYWASESYLVNAIVLHRKFNAFILRCCTNLNGLTNMNRLFVYGTLCPNRENAHILAAIGGEWKKHLFMELCIY
jgi:hypothetical protein